MKTTVTFTQSFSIVVEGESVTEIKKAFAGSALKNLTLYGILDNLAAENDSLWKAKIELSATEPTNHAEMTVIDGQLQCLSLAEAAGPLPC